MTVQLILKNSSVEDRRPTAEQLANGEVSLNYNSAGPFLCCVDTEGNVQQVAGIKLSTDAPASPVRGTMWLNLSDNGLYVYDGTNWVVVAGGGGTGGGGGGDITTVVGGNGINTTENNGVVTVTADLDTDRGLTFNGAEIALNLGEGLSFDGQGRVQAEFDALTYRGPSDLTQATVPANPTTGDVLVNNTDGLISAEWSQATGAPVDQIVTPGDLVAFNGTDWAFIPTGGVPGAGVTDLGVAQRTAETLDITSSSGMDATIPAATDALAGVMTAIDKARLDQIEDGAEANVQSDWLEDDEASPAFIQNRPEIPELVQSDWDQDDSLEPDFIRNRPEILPDAPSDGEQYLRQDGEWVEAAIPSIGGDTPPDNPVTGQLWADTSQDPPQLNVWDGNEWLGVGVQGGASVVEPVDPTDGQLWIDLQQDPPQVFVWDATNSEWITAGFPEAPEDGQQYARSDGGWVVITAEVASVNPGDGINATTDDDGVVTVSANLDTERGLTFRNQEISLNVGDGLRFNAQGQLESTVQALTIVGTLDFTAATVPADPETNQAWANTTEGTVSAEWAAALGLDAAAVVEPSDLAVWNGTTWVYFPTGGPPEITTDLGIDNRTTVSLDITSTTGDAATIPQATEDFAGLFSAADFQKLEGIDVLAEANVQADWDEDDPLVDSFIQNKPTIPPTPVQSNWAETDENDLSFIQNRPTIPAPQVQSDWSEDDTASVRHILNRPTIPPEQVQSNWDEEDDTARAFIRNKPTIPDAPVQSDWNVTDENSLAFIQNRPDLEVFLTDAPNDGQQYVRQEEAWQVARSVPGGPTPPGDPDIGELWLDMGQTPAQLFVWDGTDWVPVAAQGELPVLGVEGGDGIDVQPADDERVLTVSAAIDGNQGLVIDNEQIAVSLGAGLFFDPQGRIQANVEALTFRGTLDATEATVPNLPPPAVGDVFVNNAEGAVSAEWEAATPEDVVGDVTPGDIFVFNGTEWRYIPTGGTTGGGRTDLEIDARTATSLDVASSTGDDATIPEATQLLAGLMTAADKTRLDGIEAGAEVNVVGEAPNDGEQYVRQNEDWAQIEIPAAGIEEAPDDGVIYGRRNGDWEFVGGVRSVDSRTGVVQLDDLYMPLNIGLLPDLP